MHHLYIYLATMDADRYVYFIFVPNVIITDGLLYLVQKIAAHEWFLCFFSFLFFFFFFFFFIMHRSITISSMTMYPLFFKQHHSSLFSSSFFLFANNIETTVGLPPKGIQKK